MKFNFLGKTNKLNVMCYINLVLLDLYVHRYQSPVSEGQPERHLPGFFYT